MLFSSNIMCGYFYFVNIEILVACTLLIYLNRGRRYLFNPLRESYFTLLINVAETICRIKLFETVLL